MKLKENHIHLPKCMREGSLNEVLELMKFNTAYKFINTRHVFDVQYHLVNMKGWCL